MADAEKRWDIVGEKEALEGKPDTQAAINAGRAEVKAVEATRTNQSDGSLRKFAGLAEQEMSVELCYGDKVASRTQKLSEKELLAQARNDAPQEQSQTFEALEQAAKSDPVADVMLLFRRQADALPPGPEKERLTQLARQQAAELLASNEQDDCGVHERPVRAEAALKGQVIYPDKEIEGVKRLTPEDLRMLAAAMEAGPESARQSLQETSDQILRRTGEASCETLLAGIKTVVAILEYDRDLLVNPEEAKRKAANAGEALGVLLIAGVQISAGGIGTIEQLRQTGDCSLPFQNISGAMNRWYESQRPAEQMALAAEVCAGFGIAAGSVEVNKLRKPGAFMQFLKEGIDSLPKNPEAEKKALETLAKLFKRAQPMADTGVGAAVKARDVVKDTQEKGIMGHIMEMVQFLPEHGKEVLTDRKLRQEYGLTKRELMTKTEVELAALRIERIEASYKTVFYRAHPELKGTGLAIHHALPQSLRDKYPGLFKAKEVHSLKYLSGIPETAMHNEKNVHDLMTASWERFKMRNANPTRDQVLMHMRALDDKYGQYFVPPLKKGDR